MNAIRDVLRQHPEGLALQGIARRSGIDDATAKVLLHYLSEGGFCSKKAFSSGTYVQTPTPPVLAQHEESEVAESSIWTPLEALPGHAGGQQIRRCIPCGRAINATAVDDHRASAKHKANVNVLVTAFISAGYARRRAGDGEGDADADAEVAGVMGGTPSAEVAAAAAVAAAAPAHAHVPTCASVAPDPPTEAPTFGHATAPMGAADASAQDGDGGGGGTLTASGLWVPPLTPEARDAAAAELERRQWQARAEYEYARSVQLAQQQQQQGHAGYWNGYAHAYHASYASTPVRSAPPPPPPSLPPSQVASAPPPIQRYCCGEQFWSAFSLMMHLLCAHSDDIAWHSRNAFHLYHRGGFGGQ
jgi:hypothetical protein